MRILFLTDNFPPERNAPASRTYDHARRWVAAGHEVTVITTAPNFPEGKLLGGYKNRLVQREVIDGINVVRVMTYITANEGVAKRTLDYLSFMVTGAIAAMFERRPDVLISTSPQFFCAVAGWAVSTLRRLPWVFELRDLWPASIVAVGAMKKGLVVQMLERLELTMYHHADLVVAVTNGLRNDLVRRGIQPEKVVVVRNGVDMSLYKPGPKDPALVQEWGLSGKFVAGYLGTVGMGTAVDQLVHVAKILRERGRTDITILVAGAGAQWTAIQQDIEQLGLDNLLLLPSQEKSRMPAMWRLLDAALVTMRNTPLFASTISSKMFEAMGSGCPIVMSLPPGESTEIISTTGAGLNVAPENPQAMANALIELADNPDRLAALAKASVEAANDFSRDESASRMLTAIDKTVSNRLRNTSRMIESTKENLRKGTAQDSKGQ